MITELGRLRREELQRFRWVCAMSTLAQCGHWDLNAKEAAAAIVAHSEFMEYILVHYDLEDADSISVNTADGLITEGVA